MTTSTTNYRVKCFFNGEVFLYRESTIPSVLQLYTTIASHFHISSLFRVQWLDDEGDKITITTNEDVREAYSSSVNVSSPKVSDSETQIEASPFVKLYVTVTQTVIANTNSPITTISDNPITTIPVTSNNVSAVPITTIPVGNAITTVPIQGNTSNISPVSDCPVTVTNLDGSPVTNTVVNISGVNVVSGNDVNTNVCDLSPGFVHTNIGNGNSSANTLIHNAAAAAAALSLSPSPSSSSSPSSFSSSSVPIQMNDASVPIMNHHLRHHDSSLKMQSGVSGTMYVTRFNSESWLPLLVQLQNIGYVNTKRNIEVLNECHGDYLQALLKLSHYYY